MVELCLLMWRLDPNEFKETEDAFKLTEDDFRLKASEELAARGDDEFKLTDEVLAVREVDVLFLEDEKEI